MINSPRMPAPEKSVFVHPGSQAPVWYACRTRARAEKQVDRLLRRVGIETFTPLVHREREWVDRKKRVSFPMFPGYTFARFSGAEYLDVLRTPGVVHVVGAAGRLTPLRFEEIESVRRLEAGLQETGQIPKPVDFLVPGIPIEVDRGPFRGMRGILLESRGSARVAIRLGAVRAAVSVVLERSNIRRFAV